MKGHERFLIEGEGSRENLIFSFEKKSKGKNGNLQTRHVGRDSLTHTLKHIELKIYVHREGREPLLNHAGESTLLCSNLDFGVYQLK